MNKQIYKLKDKGIHFDFMQSRTKIQVFGGGFGNGKTAAMCVKCLNIAKDYPGANILMARSTYPKLNDTLRKEFIKWCPDSWIKSFPRSQNSVNTCTLTNGTTINFRYIQQQGKGSGEATTSNLLSATYDAIFVDQMEDPEITYKDFLDLLGRLRGNAQYIGDDVTMPDNGPRYFVFAVNPTRNWVYKKVVKPLHDFLQYGKENKDLLCLKDPAGNSVRDKEGKLIPIVSLFEGSTYENKDNLGADFIQTLESTYQGQMKDRFLYGKWAAYEGLVYPQYDDTIHEIAHETVMHYYTLLCSQGYNPTIIEGYDHGLVVPSCYLWGFVDNFGNIILTKGFYEAEYKIEQALEYMYETRTAMEGTQVDHRRFIYADPAIFRRATGDKKTVGKSVSDIFFDDGKGVMMTRGNNDIVSGIAKVGSYLSIQKNHINPFTGEAGAPHLYHSDELSFLSAEFNDYYWKQDSQGERKDEPIDKNDHGMDTVKYLLSHRPRIVDIVPHYVPNVPAYMSWHEQADTPARNRKRYG